jgi:hypothetical protein
MFGGRTPGGLSGAGERDSELRARWDVSGKLEPNCLACHDASPAYDHSEYGRQIKLENFRWAPAAASGMALVTGAAREMPNTFDYLLPFVEDALLLRRPSVAYAPERFLPGARIVFDIVREVPAGAATSATPTQRWTIWESVAGTRKGTSTWRGA